METRPAIEKNAYLWTALRTYVPGALRTGSAFFLTAYYGPAEAGTFALAWMAVILIATPADLGIKSAASGFDTYSKADAHRWIRRTRWSGLAAALLCLLSAAGMFLITGAAFTTLVLLLGAGYAYLYAWTAPSFALAQRKGRFARLARFESAGALAGSALAWLLALSGRGPAALVALYAFPPVFSCLQMLYETRAAAGSTEIPETGPLPPVRLRIIGADWLDQWIAKADSLVVGALAGSAALGYYNRAFGLIHYPQQVLTGIINPVRTQHGSGGRLSAGVEFHRILAGTFACLAFTWPAAVLAPHWIPAVWSDAWLPAARFMPPLALAGAAIWAVRACDPLLLTAARVRIRWISRLSALVPVLFLAVTAPAAGLIAGVEAYAHLWLGVALLTLFASFRGQVPGKTAGNATLQAAGMAAVLVLSHGIPVWDAALPAAAALAASWYHWATARRSFSSAL